MDQFYCRELAPNTLLKLTGAVLLTGVLCLAAALGTVEASPADSFRGVMENESRGAIEIAEAGSRRRKIGRVLQPVNRVNSDGFTASQWGEPGTVTATAVNAIHALTGRNPETGRGVIFSLLPEQFHDFEGENYYSYHDSSTSLVTDIAAGELLFGGAWSPLVGSEIYLRRGGERIALTGGTAPEVGDELVIEVRPRGQVVRSLRFHNSFGGLIRLCPTHRALRQSGLSRGNNSERIPLAELESVLPELRDGLPEGSFWAPESECFLIGQVLRPVQGVGRFLGTEYVSRGRLRANHPGVVDVSTSPRGQIGGFQIIPSGHAMSPEMGYARTLTQWMVVGPLSALDPSWEGEPPLFGHWLRPRLPDPGSVESTLHFYTDRFRVEGKIAGEWQLLPELTGRSDRALTELEELRILFPVRP